jgi:hypothetical protein
MHKLEHRTKPCIFLGYNYASYKCLDPVTNKAYLSKHVIFYEENFLAKEQGISQLSSKINAQGDAPLFLPILYPISHDLSTGTNQNAATNPIETSHLDTTSPSPSSPLVAAISSDPLSTPSTTNSTSPVVAATSEPMQLLVQPTYPMTTRSRTGTLRPKSLPDFQLYQATFSEVEPVSYCKAALDPRWQAAMQLEYDALISNGTWTLCPRPPHQNVIRNKWVYRIKKRADGSVERFKARVVAKGFEQQSGIDYTETFSPIIKASTIRVILVLAIYFDWPIRQLDVSNAFLQSSLREEVYMEQPSGFVDAANPEQVCKLHKAIYGHKQAPRAWFTRLFNFLLDIGFQGSLVDTSLFIYIHGSVQVYMLVYVDDILVIGTHPSVISSFITQLQ